MSGHLAIGAQTFVRKEYQVVIVGGGPVGMALALSLGLRGVSCALVESRTEPHRIPKGQNLTQRTLEHFYFWNIVEELRAARIMPPGYPIGEITAYRDLNGEYWHAPAGREIVHPFYFQTNERLPQYRMESVLHNRLASVPAVESCFGWSARAIEQNDSGVQISIVEEGGRGRDVLKADYVAGCDGARSAIREQAGIESGGTDFDQLMVLVVFRSCEFHRRLERFPARSTYRVLHPELKGYWRFFGRIDVGEGWFFHAPVPADTARQGFDFRALIHQAAGFEFPCELDHVGFWDLRTAVAETYQSGRVFIAGDAAHSHPPYGAFGLNNGLEDVVNLGWKLAAVLQGWGGDRLLPSYTAERRPVFEEVAEDFITARIRKDAAFLARYSPERDREEFERAWKARETDIASRVQRYESNYEGSPIVAGPPGGRCSAHGTHSFKARAGHHLAPQPLSCGRNVFEELGQGFTLLAFDAPEASVAAIRQAAISLGLPLKVVQDSCRDAREAYESRLILVRPDQYVAWTGDDAAPEGTVLSRIIGRT